MTIPASSIVSVTPGVLTAGGSSLALSGLFMTQNPIMPTFTVLSFSSLDAVGAYWGTGSEEYAAAQIYFAGYLNSPSKPKTLLFAPYNLTARAAYLQSGSFAAVPLSTLQTYSGTLTLTFAGVTLTSSTISLSAATSFSNVASLIQGGFTSPPFNVTWDSVSSTFSITSTATGSTETLLYATGTLATDLLLTAPTGAVLSQGADPDDEASAIANALAVSQNWATLVTLWEPFTANKHLIANAINALNNKYLYLAWDSDPSASVSGNKTCFGYLAQSLDFPSVACLSGDPAVPIAAGLHLGDLVLQTAAFVAGAIASIDFSRTNGRTTLAFLSSSEITVTCANKQTADNLLANGYSFYGSYATANQGFNFLYNGQMSGPFVSIVRYINQIYLNSQMQLALMTLLTSAGSIGYEPTDYNQIRNVLQDPINAALNFGTIRTGVTLSTSQKSTLNLAAGTDAASMVGTQGYYLQILDPGAAVRQAGGTPIVNFWYTDGGDVLQISMDSTDIL